MEELKRTHELRVDEISRVKNQNTVDKFMAKVQELRNEVTCMNDSRDFQIAESVRSGQLITPRSQRPCVLSSSS